MGKKKRRAKEPAAPPSTKAPAQGISIDTILAQLASLKDNSKSFIDGTDQEADAIWAADVAACEAVTAILSALQGEGIKDPDGVKDLIHDYNALAEQYRKMHQQYEEPTKVLRIGTGAMACLCPECRNQSRPGNKFCWNCGKRLDWDPIRRKRP